jgi:hypothetical protein
MPEQDDGTRHRARVLEVLNKGDVDYAKHPELVLLKVKQDDGLEEIIAYNDIVDYIEKDEFSDGVWKYEEIMDWKYVKRTDEDYKGSSINILLRWNTGELTWEPLYAPNREHKGFLHDDTAEVANYMRTHDLWKKRGWKGLPLVRAYGKTEKRLRRRANQAKLKSFRARKIFKYGFQVPRTHEEAMELD